MSNIIITGHTGFLGKATSEFLSKNHNVFPLHSKYMHNAYILFNNIIKFRPDTIINFGWGGGSNRADLNNIEQFDNIKTCIDLFKLGMKCGVNRFIQISSSWKNFNNSNSINNYSFCKEEVDIVLDRMAKLYSIELITIVPYWVYGPGDKGNRLIPSIINKCLKNEKIELHPCQNIVDYLYISDFVKAIDVILESEYYFGSISICSGDNYKIKDIIEGIKSLTNSKSEISYNKDYPTNFQMKWVGNNNKLIELGWYPKFGIEEGLKRTIEHYES